MPRLKTLKSIGHNAAHSYLSLMNYINGDYTVERIFQIAKFNNQPHVVVDILQKTIVPDVFCISEILESLEYLNKCFLRLLNAENMGFEHVKSAKIRIDFDLSATKLSHNVPTLELPSYDCTVEIGDLNGKNYISKVVEWWKY